MRGTASPSPHRIARRANPDGSLVEGPNGRPKTNVSNHEMGYIFEELIRRFSEQSNETAGEHFTPREVIRFMVNLLFAEDDQALHQPQAVRKMYDPACGTGGFFLGAYEFISKHSGLNKAQKAFLKFKTFYGNEIVANTRRMALMNMILHGIGDIDSEPSIEPTDALVAPPSGPPGELLCRLELDPHLGEVILDRLELADRLAELYALLGVVAGVLVGGAPDTECDLGVVCKQVEPT